MRVYCTYNNGKHLYCFNSKAEAVEHLSKLPQTKDLEILEEQYQSDCYCENVKLNLTPVVPEEPDPKKSDLQLFSLRLEKSLLDQLKSFAKEDGRSVNSFIIHCLKFWMDKNS